MSLALPWWMAERAVRHARPDTARPHAVVVVRAERGQWIVCGSCEAAHRAGVHAGLTLAHARALLAGREVLIADHDEHADAAALLALARWASRRWSPLVEVDAPDGLLADITGCAHLFAGERGLMEDIAHRVRGLGLTPRAAIASTAGAAWAVARFGEDRSIIAQGREREALADLPTAALRIDADAIHALAEVGIERIGHLFAVPRASLPARYGPDLLLRLDQALGIATEMVGRTPQGLRVRASLELPGGTTQVESIEAALRLLLDDVASTLERHESGLRILAAAFERLGERSDEPERIILRVSRPTRDARHLWSLLRPKLERLNMGFGVERVTLDALGLCRLSHEQRALGDRPADPQRHPSVWGTEDDSARVLDTLASRLGRASVLSARLVESHRPERAFRLVPFDERPQRGDAPASPAGPRPSRLIDPPSPAETIALTPDGPVMRVRWRGSEHRILRTIGPERIGPEWWHRREAPRDYFRVQDDRGRWLWMFHEGSAWFVHGEWC